MHLKMSSEKVGHFLSDPDLLSDYYDRFQRNILFSIHNRLTKAMICNLHYGDVIMGTVASEITSLTIVYSTVWSDADQRKHQSSALLAFVRGIHRGPVNSPHKWPVTRKMFPFDDVIMVEVNMTQYHVSNCLGPDRCETIIWTNTDIISMKFATKYEKFLFKKMDL